MLEAIAWNKPCSYQDILAFTGLSKPTVNNALKILGSLSLVNEGEAEKLFFVVDEFDKHLSSQDKILVVRKYLQHWSFFQVLCGFLDNSNGHKIAIRKTLAFFKIDEGHTVSAKNVLQLATDLNVLTFDGKEYYISETLKHPPHETEINGVELTSEMAAQLFLSKKLTPEIFYSLENPEKEKLTKALLNYRIDPEKSCEYAGQALENYLRLVGIHAGEDLTSCDGMGQIADYLGSKTRLIIHPRHREIAKTVSTIRNSSAHDRDKLTSDPWIQTSEIALVNVLLVIQLIKSIHGWTVSRSQII